ncbi:MAG: DUF4280 domain-containing protein [Acidimicrobiales bacterium]
MGMLVVAGATMQCSFGTAPSVLVVDPKNRVMAGTPAANIMDNKPTANIPPFMMCTSLANPQVAAATAAAQGVLTPQLCLPVIAAPWAPGSTRVLIGNQPALSDASKCACNWAGVISITNPGQVLTQVGP